MPESAYDRAIYALGMRAIEYYRDTGLCVFCDADDCANKPHEEHCNVGELAGIELDEDRAFDKAVARMSVRAAVLDKGDDDGS